MRFVFTADTCGLLFSLALLLALVGVPLWLANRARREARMWREALTQLPLGAILFDRRGRKLFSNPIGDELARGIGPSGVEQALQAGLKGVRGNILTGTSGTGDGSSIQAQSWPLGGRKGWVLVTLRDISEQQQAAGNYRKFIYSVSHELLTPLTAVRGHLAHIEQARKGEDDGMWRGSLDVARNEIERLTRLTSNLLLLSRLEGGGPAQRQPTALTALAEEVALQMLEKADERHVTLNIEAAPDLPRLSLDRDAWKQVFLNLIDNGIKYGKEGGHVNIRLSRTPNEAIITVADDGPGIAPEDQLHIFEEAYRAERGGDISGSGLGLTIVRRIVDQHGGSITCESALEQGTTFTIELPLEQNVTAR